MAKTKSQKVSIVANAEKELQKSATIIVADFTGLKTHEITLLRRSLLEIGAKMTVIKKRLVKLIFEKAGFTFDRDRFPGQTGIVFSPNDVVSTAGQVYRFAKGKTTFKILGGFDISEKKFVESVDVIRFGSMPSREILLGQLVGMLTIPIKQLVFVLDQKLKQTVESK